jgi:hypothetical protein
MNSNASAYSLFSLLLLLFCSVVAHFVGVCRYLQQVLDPGFNLVMNDVVNVSML